VLKTADLPVTAFTIQAELYRGHVRSRDGSESDPVRLKFR